MSTGETEGQAEPQAAESTAAAGEELARNSDFSDEADGTITCRRTAQDADR